MPDVPSVARGDEAHLRQVLINLLANAVKFTEKGGVTLHVSRVDGGPEAVTLKFSIRDTGIGIAPQDQRRIFESFTQADQTQTRRFGGTGLGTTIAKQLVELMGGRMGLESAVGLGSTFWFELAARARRGRTARPGAGRADRDAGARDRLPGGAVRADRKHDPRLGRGVRARHGPRRCRCAPTRRGARRAISRVRFAVCERRRWGRARRDAAAAAAGDQAPPGRALRAGGVRRIRRGRRSSRAGIRRCSRCPPRSGCCSTRCMPLPPPARPRASMFISDYLKRREGVRRLKVLVADDNAVNRTVLRRSSSARTTISRWSRAARRRSTQPSASGSTSRSSTATCRASAGWRRCARCG